MSKKNGNMHIVALQTSLAAALSEKAALQAALDELGYCHAQQTAFITDSASGPDGLISKDILFNENKIALREAIDTNKRLTDDLEFQAHRHMLLQAELGSRGRALAELSDTHRAEVKRLKAKCNDVLIGGRIVAAVLAIAVVGLSLQVAGVF